MANAGAYLTDGTTVTATEILPAGLTRSSITRASMPADVRHRRGVDVHRPTRCTRTDVLASGRELPPITMTTPSPTARPSSLRNASTVAGGGDVDRRDRHR